MNLITEEMQGVFYDDSQRIAIDVQLEDSNLKLFKSVRFLLDTGASSVSVPASVLRLSDSHRDFILKHSRVVRHEGIVRGVTADYYRYNIDYLRVGKDIVLKDFPINVSFDSRIKHNLLGMSFLKLFSFTINPSKAQIIFRAQEITRDLVTGQHSLMNIDNAPIIQNWLLGAVPSEEKTRIKPVSRLSFGDDSKK